MVIGTGLIDQLKTLPRIFYLFYVIMRIVIQVCQLFHIIWSNSLDQVIVQNPPCVPVLAVLVFYKTICGLIGSRFVLIVDWHNYGYTILQSNKVNSKLCAIAEVYEKFLGRYADFNLTVSEAFKEDLCTRFGIRKNSISVLYDRAVKGKFGPISLQEKHELFDRVGWTGMFTTS